MPHLVSVASFSVFLISFLPVILTQIQEGPFDDRLTDPSLLDIPDDVTRPVSTGRNVLCRDGWSLGSIVDFSGVEIPICVRVNSQPQTWSQAQDTCRKDYGFLLKLDSPAKINDVDLMSHLSENGIRRFWSGLHTYAEHLVWDDLIPNTVRPLNNPNDTLAPTRPWTWNTRPLPNTSEYCGLLNIKDDDRKRRRKRAPDEDSSDGFDMSSLRDRLYQFRQPSNDKYLATAAFQSMLSRTPFSDQLPELPGSSLGIQSEHQIPGTGLTDTNLQSGGLQTDIPSFDISSDDKEISSSDSSGTTNIMQSEFFATESPLSQAELLNSVKDIAAKLTDTNLPDSISPLDTVQEIQKDFNEFTQEKDKLSDTSVIGDSSSNTVDPSDAVVSGLTSAHDTSILGVSKQSDDTGNDKTVLPITGILPEPTKTTLTDTSTNVFAANTTGKTESIITKNTDMLSNTDSSSKVLQNNELDTKVDDLKESLNENISNSSDALSIISESTDRKDESNAADVFESIFPEDIISDGKVNTDKNDDTVQENGKLTDMMGTDTQLNDDSGVESNVEDAAKLAETLPDISVNMEKKGDGIGDDLVMLENPKTINSDEPKSLDDVSNTDFRQSNDAVDDIEKLLTSNDEVDDTEKLLIDNLHVTKSKIISEKEMGVSDTNTAENQVLTDDDLGKVDDIFTPEDTSSDKEITIASENDIADKLENVMDPPLQTDHEQLSVSDISEKLNDYMEAVSTDIPDNIKETLSTEPEHNEGIFNADMGEKVSDSLSILNDLEELKQDEYNSENVATEKIDELSAPSGLEDLIEPNDQDSNSNDNMENIIEELSEFPSLNETHEEPVKEVDIGDHLDEGVNSEVEINENDVLDDISKHVSDKTDLEDFTLNSSLVTADELMDDLGNDIDIDKTSEIEPDGISDVNQETAEATDSSLKYDTSELSEIMNDFNEEVADSIDDSLKYDDTEINGIINDFTSDDDIGDRSTDLIENDGNTDDNYHENNYGTAPDIDNDDDIQDGKERPDLAEDIQTGDTKKLIPRRVTKQDMELSTCSVRLPSVCFSYEVEVMAQASTCDDGWYGHVLLDSCYKILDGRLSYRQSVSTCKSIQARVALGESEFERNFILLAIKKEGRQLTGGKFWMEAPPTSMGCKYFDERGIAVQTNCGDNLNVVCVKDAKSLSVHTTNNAPLYNNGMDMYTSEAEFKLFSSRNPSNSLICELTSAASEFPVLWFKDGILVETRDKYITSDISLHINESLAEAFRTVTNRNITMASLQGKYWCEVWDRKSLSRKRSRPYDVRFSDVISFHGSLQLKGPTPHQQILFNMMNEQFPSLTNLEMDLKTVFSDALPAVRAAFPGVYDVFTYADRVRSFPSVIEYHTFYSMSRDYTINEERSLYSRLKAVLKTKLGNSRYMASLPGQTPVSTFRTMSLQSTVSCPSTFLQTNLDVNGKKIPIKSFQFPQTLLGEFANSIDNCSSTNNYPGGTARCLGDFYTGAYWGDVVANDCIDESFIDQFNVEIWGASPFTDELSEIAQTVVKQDNVDRIVSQVAHITEVAAKLTPTDINKIADVLDHTTQFGKLPEKVGKAVLKTVDKLMASSEKEMHVANIETKAANRIIKSLERFAEQADLGTKKNVRMVSDNVVVEVWDLQPNSEPVIGLAAETRVKTIDTPFKDEIIATVFNKSQLVDANVDAAIELPKEVFGQKEKGISLGNRLTMMVFRKSKLFRAALSTSDGKVLKPTDEQLDKLNSYVISASIAGKKLTGLKESVRTIFRPLKDHAGTRSCVWWDFELNNFRGGWSPTGCYYDGKINGRDVCLCNHLTNFAVLLDFYGQSEPIPDHHELSLSIITVLGLACSILGLSLTIISYVFFRKLRQGRAQQTLFNLSLALLFSMIVFLVGIKQTHNYVGCLVVAILLHYFILVSFMWMLMEAILQYLTFVKILGTYITRFTLKSVLPAWGLPLVPVISVLSIDYHLYHGGPNYCWMDLSAFYFAFAAPITCIIAINIVIFFITIVSIFRRGKGLRSNQKRQKMAMTNLQAAITSFILLGLTWVFGYLAISDARLPFQYVFTILNSLQGFFIFILFVVRKKKVREQWYIICCKAGEKDRVSRSLSASNSIPSSYSNGSNRNSRNSKHERDRSDSTKTTQSTYSNSSGGFTNYGYDHCYESPYNRHGKRFRKF